MAKGDRVVAEEVQKSAPVVGARRYELAWTFFGGASVGFVVWVVAWILQRFVFSNLLCAGAATCSEAVNYAGLVAMIVGSIAGLVVLTTTQVYRPLLVIVASALSLWGFESLVAGMSWYWALIASMIMFGLAYAAFAWLARVRNFVLTIVIVVILVVAARLALNS
jgi:hypothetical protein